MRDVCERVFVCVSQFFLEGRSGHFTTKSTDLFFKCDFHSFVVTVFFIVSWCGVFY